MNRRTLPLTIAVAAALVLGLTVLNRAQTATTPQPAGAGLLSMIQPGTHVTVFLRGDASGVAFTDRSANGFLIGREGTVQSVDDKWLVVDNKGTKSFLPLSAIAVIDAAK